MAERIIVDEDGSQEEVMSASSKILLHIASMPIEIMREKMLSREPFNALRAWAMEDLGMNEDPGQYLGYAIQAICEERMR